jgi:hypothetical protein
MHKCRDGGNRHEQQEQRPHEPANTQSRRAEDGHLAVPVHAPVGKQDAEEDRQRQQHIEAVDRAQADHRDQQVGGNATTRNLIEHGNHRFADADQEQHRGHPEKAQGEFA